MFDIDFYKLILTASLLHCGFLTVSQTVRAAGDDVYDPLLQIFWDSGSPFPSTVILLDSAVVIPDRKSGFKICHAKKPANPKCSMQKNRTFSCSNEKDRDDRVFSINQALLMYEKEKARGKKSPTMVFQNSIRDKIKRNWTKDVGLPPDSIVATSKRFDADTTYPPSRK